MSQETKRNLRRTAVLSLGLLAVVAWLFWGAVQTRRGLYFEWSSASGFRNIDACRLSSKLSRAIEAPYCALVAAQSKRFIVARLKESGWTEAKGTLAPMQLPFLPIVWDVRLEHFQIVDPTVTELMRASKLGDANLVKKLLAEGAQVNARDQNGATALMYACAAHSGASNDILQALFSANADVNLADRSGATALHVATGDGVRLICVKELLLHGANPNAQNGDGDTPLIDTVTHAQNEEDASQAAQLLIDAGADPSLSNHQGQSALSWAQRLGLQSLAQLLAGGRHI